MQAIIRRPQHYKLFKSCNHSNNTLKCLCNENDQIQKYSSVHFQVLIPTTIVQNAIVKNTLRSPAYNYTILRNFSLTHMTLDKEPLKPSSKVEVTVKEIKKQKEEAPAAPQQTAVVKKTLKQKVVDELVHYYHGFRLLFIDIKISTGLVWRILKGKTLTRQEHRLLVRTVGDMFRLVPFSVFIIVPFMEFLLPVFIKFFPGMLPSTFETSSEKETKIKKNLKVKIEMAKFLQQTLDDMAVQHTDHNSTQAKEFNEWVKKMRTSGQEVTNEEIMKYSKLFEDEITLESLSRNQLIALCRVLEVQTLGTNNLLRFQLRMKIRSLIADDNMIKKEGVESLTLNELQQACRARGMRAYGVPEDRLQSQLSQWLDLSLNEKVPPSLLLLSRALMLPETADTHDKLKATISSLPETIMTQTEAAIGEKEGKIDNKVKIQVLKEEERKIKEERKEQQKIEEQKKLEKKEILVDTAPILTAKETPDLVDTAKDISVETEKPMETPGAEALQAKDLEAIEHALENISKDKKTFVVEKEVIQELKEEMAEYEEDVADLKRATADEPKPAIQETKAAQRLFKSVNKMIGKLDHVLGNLENKEKKLRKDLETEETDIKKEELLRIDDILEAIKKIKNVPDDSRIEQIKNVLGKIDVDADGSIKVEDVLKVIEFIGKENVNLSSKQVDELIELLGKEEILEVEEKIEKALQKQKDLNSEEETNEKVGTKKKKLSETEITILEPASTIDSKSSEEQSKLTTPSSKLENQPPIISPPPISSIDPVKPSNNSKTL